VKNEEMWKRMSGIPIQSAIVLLFLKKKNASICWYRYFELYTHSLRFNSHGTVFMILGQSAATAAALAIDNGVTLFLWIINY
jgi:hypothetical protein